MALKSRRVTKKELETYYSPKTSDYSFMVDSINSNEYGQIIENYSGDLTLNTYYNIWDNKLNSMVVYDKGSGNTVLESEAGPTFWGVSSAQGVAFLGGFYSISGLRKLKYCNSCSDGNGLKKPVIENFKQRFTQLKELLFNFNLLDGFLFYDQSLTRFQNVFPAAKIDDGVNLTYQFKNINGTDLSVQDMSTLTNKPVVEIELSITTAPIVKPQEGANTVIISCCNEKEYFVISGQYTIGDVLYTTDLPNSYCWYVESLTKELPNIYATFTSGGRTPKQCVYTYSCPSACDTISMAYSFDPLMICNETIFNNYDVNWNTLEIWLEGSCGNNPAKPGYYYDGKMIYFWDGVSFTEYGSCSQPDTSSTISHCCNGTQYVIDGVYPVGTVLYTKDVYPAECYSVIATGTDFPTNTMYFTDYEGTCKDCTNDGYNGGCN
jgi:hypothetical protein